MSRPEFVRTERTVIYKTPKGRRYLTKAAAYRRAAWERITAKYKCACVPDEIGDGGVVHGGTGTVCERHADREHFEKVAMRLARLMARADRRHL